MEIISLLIGKSSTINGPWIPSCEKIAQGKPEPHEFAVAVALDDGFHILNQPIKTPSCTP